MARVVKAPDVRRDEIVSAARDLFAERGVRATTFADVAERVGVTRGLVYHYAGDIESLVDAVLESCVADFVADLHTWDAARQEGNIDQAVVDCITLFRRHVPTRRRTAAPDTTPTPDGAPAPAAVPGRPLPRLDDAALYVRFLDQAVDALIDALEVTTIPAYAARHTIEIRHVRETFHVLIHGLMALVRAHPEVPDQVLADLVRQTLRLAPNSAATNASAPHTPGAHPRRRPTQLEGD